MHACFSARLHKIKENSFSVKNIGTYKTVAKLKTDRPYLKIENTCLWSQSRFASQPQIWKTYLEVAETCTLNFRRPLTLSTQKQKPSYPSLQIPIFFTSVHYTPTSRAGKIVPSPFAKFTVRRKSELKSSPFRESTTLSLSFQVAAKSRGPVCRHTDASRPAYHRNVPNLSPLPRALIN